MSIYSFCTNYQRLEQCLDAIIFAHEYGPIGNILSCRKSLDWEK
jgi:hypothetical protein